MTISAEKWRIILLLLPLFKINEPLYILLF